MEKPELNKQTGDLMYANNAIESDIRQRSFSDQYPELYQSLIEANKAVKETSESIDKLWKMHKMQGDEVKEANKAVKETSESIDKLWKMHKMQGDEVNEANKAVKETSESIDKLWKMYKMQGDEVKEIKGWQRHYDNNLETVFTDIAFEYLGKKSPINEIINIFQLQNFTPSKKWIYPPQFDFEVDGLIYDATENIVYMVESKFHLTLNELSKAMETWNQLTAFIHSAKMENTDAKARNFNRLWNFFFGGAEAVIQRKDLTVVKSFLGFHSVESEAILDEARGKGFQLIGPDGNHYRVYE